MKLIGGLKKAGQAILLSLFCLLLFNNPLTLRSKNEDTKKIIKEYFISSSNHLSGLLADEDYSNPADNEEDEDEDDNEDGAESLVSKSHQEFIVSTCYNFHQDRLFCDPHGELVSPPPKF